MEISLDAYHESQFMYSIKPADAFVLLGGHRQVGETLHPFLKRDGLRQVNRNLKIIKSSILSLSDGNPQCALELTQSVSVSNTKSIAYTAKILPRVNSGTKVSLTVHVPWDSHDEFITFINHALILQQLFKEHQIKEDGPWIMDEDITLRVRPNHPGNPRLCLKTLGQYQFGRYVDSKYSSVVLPNWDNWNLPIHTAPHRFTAKNPENIKSGFTRVTKGDNLLDVLYITDRRTKLENEDE